MLFVFSGTSPFATSRAQDADAAPSPEKVRRAEEAAARFLTRFNETLDYRVPYREMFAPSARREDETTIPMLTGEDGDFMTVQMTLFYLKAAYWLTHKDGKLPRDLKAARADEPFPYLQDLDKAKRGTSVAAQRRAFRNYFRNTHRLVGLFRRYLPATLFASPACKTRVAKLDRSMDGNEPRARVEKGYSGRGFENQDVYRVLHGGFEYYLGEVGGEFKVVHINPLPGFRMSP